MYFKDKENTNIDSEFETEKIKLFKNGFNFSNKLFIISGCILLFLIVLIIFMVIRGNNKKNAVFITLNGEMNITIYQDSDYIEMGYEAYNLKGEDLSDKVLISGVVDVSKIGNYELIYSIGDKSVSRNVSVIEKPTGATYIYLKGSSVIYLDKDSKYKEPGYIVVDTVDNNLTDNVLVSGDIDTTKAGIYKLIYSVKNSSGISTIASRTIVVVDPNVSLSLSTYDIVKDSVKINVLVKDNYFDYMILPDGTSVSDISYSYKVSENGIYAFTIYSKHGEVKRSEIKVENIDNILPSGSCNAIVNGNQTTISVSASDNVGILEYKYIINGVDKSTTTNRSYTTSLKADNASVVIYDKAGNEKKVNCTVTVKEIKPSSPSSSSSSPSSKPSTKPSTPSSSKPSTPSTPSTSHQTSGLVTLDVTKSVIGCDLYYNGYGQIFKTLRIDASIQKQLIDILEKLCTFSETASYIGPPQTAGTTGDGKNMHGRGLAIDVFNYWRCEANGKTYTPYGKQGTTEFDRYNRFVCEVCNGKEECQYNIIYKVWNNIFKPKGWCWGGNWGESIFDPMHFEYNGGNCGNTSYRPKINCARSTSIKQGSATCKFPY